MFNRLEKKKQIEQFKIICNRSMTQKKFKLILNSSLAVGEGSGV